MLDIILNKNNKPLHMIFIYTNYSIIKSEKLV